MPNSKMPNSNIPSYMESISESYFSYIVDTWIAKIAAKKFLLKCTRENGMCIAVYGSHVGTRGPKRKIWVVKDPSQDAPNGYEIKGWMVMNPNPKWDLPIYCIPR
jgi:hypothetical protein